MTKSMLSLLSVAVLCVGSLSLAAVPAWPDIKVEVKADQPVTTTQSLKQQADGFHHLAITLSSHGQQPLTIEKITVRIPVAERLMDDLEMLYGGSCMGRTPLLRHNGGTRTKLSSGHMYEMVRLVFRGQLL
jgi:alpha-galactosidase